MIPFHNAMSISPVGSSKTYPEFVAHIMSLAADPSEGAIISWDANIPNGAFVVQAGMFDVGVMNGSSWGPLAGGWFNSVSNIACRILQHALPSPEVFAQQKADSLRIFVRTSPTSSAAFPSVSRNGYTSEARSSGGRLTMTELIRWDGVQAWKSNPSVGGAETEYTW